MAEPLTRVDSAVQGLHEPESPVKDEKNTLTRVDSAVQGLPESPTNKTFDRIDSGVADVSPTSPTDNNALERVDSGIQGLEISPKEEAHHKKVTHRRKSSSANVLTMREIFESFTKIELAPETQRTGWKINTSPTKVEDKDILNKPLIQPLVKGIDLLFPTGAVVTARAKPGSGGITIKDALEAIRKKNTKRSDDELPEPYLAGFEWTPSHETYTDKEREEGMAWHRAHVKDKDYAKFHSEPEIRKDWMQLKVHLSATPGVSSFGGGKKKKKNAE